MQSKIIFTVLLSSLLMTNISYASIITGDGELVSNLELNINNFRNIVEDNTLYDSHLLLEPSDVLTSTINYNNNKNPLPDELRAYGDASLSVQYGKIIGVSSWFGLQPQPWWGLAGVVSEVISEASFTIPNITIDYRGIEERADSVSADIHVTTNIVGSGRHSLALWATTPGKSQPKYLLNDTMGNISLTNLVTNFTGHTLPVGNLFNLSLNAQVSSSSIQRTTIADGDGIRHQSAVNWSVTLGGSPAFILPEGYYANSADGSIVDNYFVDVTAQDPSTEVPEPANFALIAFITLGLVYSRSSALIKNFH